MSFEMSEHTMIIIIIIIIIAGVWWIQSRFFVFLLFSFFWFTEREIPDSFSCSFSRKLASLNKLRRADRLHF